MVGAPARTRTVNQPRKLSGLLNRSLPSEFVPTNTMRVGDSFFVSFHAPRRVRLAMSGAANWRQLPNCRRGAAWCAYDRIDVVGHADPNHLSNRCRTGLTNLVECKPKP